MAVVAVANTSTYIQGGIEYSTSTSSSGITVTVRLYFRRINVWSGSTNSSNVTESICISSSSTSYGYSQNAAVTVAGGQQNVWQGPFYTASRTFDASRGGETIYVGWKTTDNAGSYFNNTGGTTVAITLPTTATAPTGLAVDNIVPSQEGFSADVSVTGWGGAGSSATRYRELQVCTYSGSGLTEPKKINVEYGDTLSSNITTSDTLYTGGTLDIEPNTEYVIGAYATNGTYNTGSQRISAVTTLPPTTVITNTAVTSSSATFTYSVPDQGGKYDMVLKYQLDSETPVSVATLTGSGVKSGTFTITGLDPDTTYSVVASLATTAGEVVSNTVSITTEKNYTVYGSVNGEATPIAKLYCSLACLTPTSYALGSQSMITSFDAAYLERYGGAELEKILGFTLTVSLRQVDFTYTGATENIKMEVTFSDNSKYTYYDGLLDASSYILAVKLGCRGLDVLIMNPPGVDLTDSVTMVTNLSRKTKIVKKIYGSVSGVTKRVF